ncbi:MAG: hypothetical protein WCV73_03620 [Patescibacteria group bacterium]|jgi:hypothetical protein
MGKFTKLFLVAIAICGGFLLANSASAATFLNVSLNESQPESRDLNLDYIGLAQENVPVWVANINLTNADNSAEALNVSTLYISTATGSRIIFSKMTLVDGIDNENHEGFATTEIKSGYKALVFRNLNITLGVGETKVLQVWGTLNGSLRNNYINQLGVTTRGSVIARGVNDRRYSVVSGNFPVLGNIFRLIMPRSYGTVNYAGNEAVVSVSRGTTNVELAHFNFVNEERSQQDMNLTSVKVTNYGTANSNRTLSSVGLYDGDRLLVRGTLSGRTYTFKNFHHFIQRGGNHVLTVKGNISRNAVVDSTIIMGINAVADLKGVNANPNGFDLATIFSGNFPVRANEFRILGEGRLTVQAESNPATTNVVARADDVPMLNLRFTATNSAFRINHLRISQTNDDLFDRSIASVRITYQNEAGENSLVGTALNNGNADLNLSFDPAYVAANSSAIIRVFADLNPINPDWGAYTGDAIQLTFKVNQGFEARAVGVNLPAIQNVGERDIPGNDMIVHGSVPTITADDAQGNLANGSVDLYRFRVTAPEDGTDLSLKKLSFKVNLNDSVTLQNATATTLMLRNFEILEGDSYNNASALTQADRGNDSYQIYNGYGATNTIATGFAGWPVGGKLSHSSGTIAAFFPPNVNTRDVVVVFNDDRLIRQGQSKYYILRARAMNVDTGNGSNDSISTYMFDGDQNVSAYKGLEASCDFNNNRAAGIGSKYCLSSDGRANDTAAYFIWSDTTGTEGNYQHQDINADSNNNSQDWFNGWKIKTLNVQRTLN